MPVYRYKDLEPVFEDRDSSWVAPDALVCGDVHVGRDANVWFGATIRADLSPVRIGRSTNVQELAIFHADPGFPLEIGENCTIGHGAMLHGCQIGEGTLVGMRATIMNGAKIGPGSIVGAGALVTEGKEFPAGSLIIGSPARAVRPTTDAEKADNLRASAHYAASSKSYRVSLTVCEEGPAATPLLDAKGQMAATSIG